VIGAKPKRGDTATIMGDSFGIRSCGEVEDKKDEQSLGGERGKKSKKREKKKEEVKK